MNTISFDKTIDPLMARNHTLAPSSDFDGVTPITSYTRVTNSRAIAGTLDQKLHLKKENKRNSNWPLSELGSAKMYSKTAKIHSRKLS